MKNSKKNSEHYYWGNNCSGWHLAKSKNLSVIEELMPHNTSEEKHYHDFSEQFFYILEGEATFEIEKEIIKVEKGEGISVLPKVVHRIKNEEQHDLEFIVISQPTTQGDRINAPFNEEEELNLNGKKFGLESTSINGEVSMQTVFYYGQKNKTIWADYSGGEVVKGTLIGKIIDNHLEFVYQHINTKSELMTGTCKSYPEYTKEGKIRLKEIWQWTCKDNSRGQSALIEI